MTALEYIVKKVIIPCCYFSSDILMRTPTKSDLGGYLGPDLNFLNSDSMGSIGDAMEIGGAAGLSLPTRVGIPRLDKMQHFPKIWPTM